MFGTATTTDAATPTRSIGTDLAVKKKPASRRPRLQTKRISSQTISTAIAATPRFCRKANGTWAAIGNAWTRLLAPGMSAMSRKGARPR